MFPALVKILLRTLVAGFYRVHAGLLLTLFAGLFINFFFTNVLNQTHLTKDQILLYNLKLVLTSVSNPVAMGLLFIIWLGYTIKSYKYVLSQLVLNQHQFLFYSSNSLPVKKQFQAWFIAQFIISLPIIALGLFAVVTGIIFNYYLIPLIIPIYLLFLISGSAFYYVRFINDLNEKKTKSYDLDWIKNWPKPFFSLFFYQIIYRSKLTYGITKITSGVVIISMYVLFSDKLSDIRIAGMSVLSVVIAHSVLIFQSNEFEMTYLRFSLNFPYSKKRIYLHFAALFSLLILPETLWFFCIYDLSICLEILLLSLSSALLFRAILYGPNQQMDKYLKVVFGLFILSSLAILFSWLWWLTAVNFAFSFFIFNQNYYRSLDH